MERIPDFGVRDTIYLRWKSIRGLFKRNQEDEASFKWNITPIEPIIREADSDYWFCFLPSFIAIDESALPKEGNVYCYSPPRAVGSARRGKTRDALKRISDVALDQISGLNLGLERKANFVAISTGVASSFDVASSLAENGLRLNRVVSVVAGMDFPWCIHNSTATRDVARNARKIGYFHEDLEVFSPGRNIGGLSSATSLEFYLGGSDEVVPHINQCDLVEKAVEVIGRDKVKVRTYENSGHIQAVEWFLKDWQG